LKIVAYKPLLDVIEQQVVPNTVLWFNTPDLQATEDRQTDS